MMKRERESSQTARLLRTDDALALLLPQNNTEREVCPYFAA